VPCITCELTLRSITGQVFVAGSTEIGLEVNARKVQRVRLAACRAFVQQRGLMNVAVGDASNAQVPSRMDLKHNFLTRSCSKPNSMSFTFKILQKKPKAQSPNSEAGCKASNIKSAVPRFTASKQLDPCHRAKS
jgi:hypothetical protein